MRILGVNWKIWVADLVLIVSRILGSVLPKLNFKLFGLNIKLGSFLATIIGFPGKYLLIPALILTAVLVVLHVLMRNKSKLKRMFNKVKGKAAGSPAYSKVASVGSTVKKHVVSYPDQVNSDRADGVQEIHGFDDSE